ncbi:hypothetical protein EXIGLDRAFT_779580 [Exidia glandulosa HHB12029]|uniref:F-box domain-containing protein n=1 Tax=Exidia glandulosa HHB12029 TaxID=1314781 RepID=A0A165BZU4_EXIGL|nr:hypothetical protein EXIGLDRAFT_779580 [Exidia glandulosa HHB12029]
MLAALEESISFVLTRLESIALSFEHARSQLQLLAQAHKSVPGSKALLRSAGVQLNRHAPVNKLPEELLCAIFRWLDEDILHNTPARVCSHWRTIALADPILWTCLKISSRAQFENAAPELVRRSRGAPLRVHIYAMHAFRWDDKGGVVPLWLDFDQCGPALAGRIQSLAITTNVPSAVTSQISNLVSCLLDPIHEGGVQLTSLRITCGPPGTPTNEYSGRSSLRRFSTDWAFLPGTWMGGLTHMEILHSINLPLLLNMLAFTPNLQSLHLENLRYSTAHATRPQRPMTLSLDNLLCRCSSANQSDWKELLEHCNPPGRCIDRIAITGSHTSYDDVKRDLLDQLDSIRALRVWCVDPVRWNLPTAYTLADRCGRRRHFVLHDLEPVRNQRLQGILDSGRLFRDITCLTMQPAAWDRLCGLLCNDMDLPQLRSITFEIKPTPGSLRDQQVVFLDVPSTHVFNQLFPLRVPLLREITLVAVHTATHPPQKAVVDSTIAAMYVRKLLYDIQNPPLLRIVNASLDVYPSDALEDLRALVLRIVEVSWDHSDAQLQWAGGPEYAFGWKD